MAAASQSDGGGGGGTQQLSPSEQAYADAQKSIDSGAERNHAGDDDMSIFLWVIQTIGIPWPSTKPEVLRQWGGLWDASGPLVTEKAGKLDTAVTSLSTQNKGPTMDAAKAFFADGSRSNVPHMKELAQAATAIGDGHRIAATAVDVMRAYAVANVIATVAGAILTGGLLMALFKTAIQRIIEGLIMEAVMKMIGLG